MFAMYVKWENGFHHFTVEFVGGIGEKVAIEMGYERNYKMGTAITYRAMMNKIQGF